MDGASVTIVSVVALKHVSLQPIQNFENELQGTTSPNFDMDGGGEIGHRDIADDQDVESDPDSNIDDSDEEGAPGRISGASHEHIQNGFLEVQRLAKQVAKETGLSASQVWHQWASASQRTHTKRNRWNLYGMYFKDHEEQERARLVECESINVLQCHPVDWF